MIFLTDCLIKKYGQTGSLHILEIGNVGNVELE